MKLFLPIFVMICFFLSSSWASDDLSEKPIIDEELLTYEQELNAAENECIDKEKNPIKQMKCGEKLREKYRKEGKLRGTDEYCKLRYGRLNTEELNNTWKRLKKLRSKARIISPGYEKAPGEVTEVMFRIEESWVEDQLAQRRKGRIKALGKELYEETEKGRGE